ncbi:permease [Lactobacillus amylovorus DSM 16698]|uniref:Permease n=1 Tax=Lactobacillus amylovorus subsp. animalium DSM 16698 TaxID=695563 RepID=A0A0R2KFY7_LACAM|nr:permease [Lactobacillus amylovorus DSM 16698]
MSSMIADLHLSGGAAGLISSITNLGMLVGGICFGILGDKIGRVKTFSHTVLIFALATGLMAFANNIYEIYALRFLTGIGAGGEYGVGIALIAENFESGRIGKMTSIAAVGGQIGAIFAALIAAWIIPTAGWHALFLVGVVPVILTVFIRRHLHESINSSKLKKMKKVHYYVMSLKKCFQPHVLLFKA